MNRNVVAVALLVGGLLAAAHGYGWALIAAMIVAVFAAGAARAGRAAFPISAHRSGFTRGHVRRHEEGHARVARGLGCKVHVDLDEGVTTVVSGPPLTAIEHAAIAYGGQVRAGRGGHGEDDRIAQRHLKTLPRSERRAAQAEAKKIARRYA